MRQKWGKKVSRSKEKRTTWKRSERKEGAADFYPEQKFEILKDIELVRRSKRMAKHPAGPVVVHKWKRQLEVGVRASLRNSRPLKSTI